MSDDVRRTVDAQLRGYVERRGLPTELCEAVVYAALGPGKRVRPLVVMRAYEAVACSAGDAQRPAPAVMVTTQFPGVPAASLADSLSGGVGERALPGAMAAIEMVHAFSLVHDDLPAMDDDDLRRGRPTLHKHAGEAMAILGGDALLALAFELLSHEVDDAALALALIRELSRATNDMIAGQVYDTFPSPPPPPEVGRGLAPAAPAHHPHADAERGSFRGAGEASGTALENLTRTHRLKTGALLRCAARMGGLCGGAAEAELDALTRYTDALGLMFQVVDDLLDVTSDAARLGKATQKDAAAGKRTYPGLLGVEGARGEVARLQREAHAALQPFGPSADALRRLIDELVVRQR